MEHKEFDDLTRRFTNVCLSRLERKGQYYAGDESNRLAHFDRIAELVGMSREKVLGVLMAKHLISVYDYIEHCEDPNFDEPLGDAIAYLLILYTMLIKHQWIEAT